MNRRELSEKEGLRLERYERMCPVGNRLVIRPQNDIGRDEELTKGGIIIPSTTRRSNEYREGMVLSVGPLCTEVKEGDIVMWPTREGEFADGMYGYELMSLKESQIVLVLEK